MYPRYCKPKILSALKDTPVVIIAGPRQCGKTTLAKEIKKDDWQYITLDDITQLEYAHNDPIGFIRNLRARHVIIDEIQRAPELFLAIKQSVDENRTPGKFLLTGSANALLLPKLSDSLAGRIEIIDLLPLTQCEIQNTKSTFIKKLLSKKPPETQTTQIRETLTNKIIAGGFPEPLKRKEASRRNAWYTQYINSIIQKDIKDLGRVEYPQAMPKLISLLAQHSGQIINYNELSGKIGISRQSLSRYTKLLEQLFIFENLPAWHQNENKRIIKKPKIHIVDSGLLCALKRANKEKIADDPALFGSLVESYIVCEIKRLTTWFEEPLYFYYYRDKDQVEVDLIIETLSGEVIGIEIKSTATVRKKDFQGLERLKRIAGEKFHMGLLLYDGDHTNMHSENIFSAPLATVWE